MSCDGIVAHPGGAVGLSAFVIMVFPDHTHLLFLYLKKKIKKKLSKHW